MSELTVSVMGEAFRVSAEDGWVWLKHPQWSLLGRGRSVGEAERDLRSEADDIADVYENLPDEALSDEAKKLLDFCLKVRGSARPVSGVPVVSEEGGNQE